jgi:hypothetical protein
MPLLTSLGAAGIGLAWGWLAADISRQLRAKAHFAIVAIATALVIAETAIATHRAGACGLGLVLGVVGYGIWRIALHRYTLSDETRTP